MDQTDQGAQHTECRGVNSHAFEDILHGKMADLEGIDFGAQGVFKNSLICGVCK